MNTKNIDQDAFLTLFLTREPSLPEIAKQLGVSIATLVAYIKSPEIKQLLADIEQITHDRNRLLAAEAMLGTTRAGAHVVVLLAIVALQAATWAWFLAGMRARPR